MSGLVALNGVIGASQKHGNRVRNRWFLVVHFVRVCGGCGGLRKFEDREKLLAEVQKIPLSKTNFRFPQNRGGVRRFAEVRHGSLCVRGSLA